MIDIQKNLPVSSWFDKLEVAFAAGESAITVEGGSQSSNDITVYRKYLKPSFASSEVKSEIEPATFSLKPSEQAKEAGQESTPVTNGSAATSGNAATPPEGLNYYAWSVTTGKLGDTAATVAATTPAATSATPATTSASTPPA